MVEFLAAGAAQRERRYELIKEEFLAECRLRSLEPPSADQADRYVRSALSQAGKLLAGRVAGRLASVTATGVRPRDARFAVRMECRLASALNANEVWDLDHLIRPTLDAMEGVFGVRGWKRPPQAADDRVDRIEATKRLPRADEVPGATIDVWLISPD